MLPVSGRPLLERIMGQLRDAGIRHVSIATYYMKDTIAEYFGAGAAMGLSINYVEEDEPSGTAGALGRLEPWAEPLLVINGDILTRLDFAAMLEFHREHDAAMTVGVRQYDLNVPYGVVESNDHRVVRVVEKPQYRYFINAGVYLLGPEVRRYIPTGQRCEMPDLINRLADGGLSVVSFPIFEYWLDIGRIEDYERGRQDAEGWNA
jgi:NDP-sugar pyrophosphorylase family protein